MRKKKRMPAGLFKTGHHDENHAEIVAALCKLGPEPYDTTKVGKGFPDLCWPFQGTTVLIEIKTEDGTLTPAQERFREEWRGGIIVELRSAADVPAMVELVQKIAVVRRKIIG